MICGNGYMENVSYQVSTLLNGVAIFIVRIIHTILVSRFWLILGFEVWFYFQTCTQFLRWFLCKNDAEWTFGPSDSIPFIWIYGMDLINFGVKWHNFSFIIMLKLVIISIRFDYQINVMCQSNFIMYIA